MDPLLALPRPLLVGVSGGLDSVYLLHQLCRVSTEGLIVCHFNHELRGADSQRDECFVADLAKGLTLPFESGHGDIAALSLARKESVETTAREERYRFFGEVATKRGTREVAVAHHAEDQAETILLHLCRGSYGLRGMRDKQELTQYGVRVWRPLLGQRKAAMREWLLQEGLSWCEDLSNASPDSARNRLRHEVVPLLKDVFSRDVVPFLARSGEDQANKVLPEFIERLDFVDPQGRLFFPKLQSLSTPGLKAVLHWYLKGEGIENLSERKLTECAGLIDDQTRWKVNLAGGMRCSAKSSACLL